MALKKRDWIFLAIVAAVIGTFVAISGEEKTTRVPLDDTHRQFHQVARTEGKKAAEKFCGNCHGPNTPLPFPTDHPPAFRCLFCHKLAERAKP